MESFKKKNYAELCRELKEVQSWLGSLEIDTAGTRLEEIINNLEWIIERYNRDPAGGISSKPDEIDIEKFWYCMTDAYSFIDVYGALKTLKSHLLPRRKLKEALSGPLLPRAEAPGTENVNSRNIFFELELAARLMRRGIRVTGFEDVQFSFEGYPFCVQCKRLLSKANMKHNIDKAYDQVKKALSDHNNARGVIALSIEKLWKIDGLVLDVQSPAGAAGSDQAIQG